MSLSKIKELADTQELLHIENVKLAELEQQLFDCQCTHEKSMIADHLVECENVIIELDLKVAVLQSELKVK